MGACGGVRWWSRMPSTVFPPTRVRRDRVHYEDAYRARGIIHVEFVAAVGLDYDCSAILIPATRLRSSSRLATCCCLQAFRCRPGPTQRNNLNSNTLAQQRQPMRNNAASNRCVNYEYDTLFGNDSHTRAWQRRWWARARRIHRMVVGIHVPSMAGVNIPSTPAWLCALLDQ